MSGFLGDLLGVLRGAPKPVKYTLTFLLFVVVLLALAFLTGLGQHWLLFVGGAVLLTGLLLAVNVLFSFREKLQEEAFEGGLKRESQRGASHQEVRQAVRELSQRWAEAMRELKRSGHSIYTSPWYLLVGEPQSGKSTTLGASGLEFPLGREALSGAGGTRNCDWWFANDAVILDTAGRFTFQEEQAPDREEWIAFLKMLRRYRPQCPINGVLVVIPCTSLLEDSAEEQERKAQNIRNKLREVQKVLEIRFPVFVLITKADRIFGFTELFSKLDPEDHRQLLGWSSPKGAEGAYDPEGFDATFTELANRLHRLRLRLVAREDNLAMVDRIWAFPEELRAMRGALKRYIAGIFQASRYEDPLLFRGYYLTSGVQQGKPIVQATRELLSEEGAPREVVESLEKIFKRSRSFFIRDVYEAKVFPEQGLIARTRAAAEKDLRLRAVMLAASIAIGAVVIAAMIPAYLALRGLVAPVEQTVARAEVCIQAPCSVTEAYDIARRLQEQREGLRRRGLTFAVLLRGARSNELDRLLGEIGSKVMAAQVVTPLLRETEARMAAISWADADEPAPLYRTFEEALSALLQWRAHLTREPSEIARTRAADLQLQPLLGLCRAVKGGGEQGSQLDAWMQALTPTDKPDELLRALAPEGTRVEVPRPTLSGALERYGEFWSVAVLARWDQDLQRAIGEYQQRYGELLAQGEPGSGEGLASVARAATALVEARERAAAAMQRPRPAGLPGPGLEAWRKDLTASYVRMRSAFGGASADLLTEPRYKELWERLGRDSEQLSREMKETSPLVLREGGKVSWAPGGEAAYTLLRDTGDFADLEKYGASDEVRGLQQMETLTSVEESNLKLEAWRQAQVQKRDALALRAQQVGTALPAPLLRWGEAGPLVERTTELAFAYRVLPYAARFFSRGLVTDCPEELCCAPVYARGMLGQANKTLSAITGLRVFGQSPELRALASELTRTENDYLLGCIERQAPVRVAGGGPSFQVPVEAMRATSWPGFHQAIARWQPVGGGDAPPPVQDERPRLLAQDIEQIVAGNKDLKSALQAYRRKALVQPKGPAKLNPDLVAAAETYKGTIRPLPDDPALAWKQLSANPLLPPEKQLRPFSQNPSLRFDRTIAQLKSVEDVGIDLLRREVRGKLGAESAGLVQRINAWTGKNLFPFVRSLDVERARYRRGDLYTRSGDTLTLNLPTIGQQELRDLASVSALADRYAAALSDPTIEGAPALKTALAWSEFLFGSAAPLPGAKPAAPSIREQRLEVRLRGEAGAPDRTFVGHALSQMQLFSPKGTIRPSIPQPVSYVWTLAESDARLYVRGVNEGTQRSATLEITGGPLRLFYLAQLASAGSADGKTWRVRLELPDAGRLLSGLFDFQFEEPLPGALGE